MANEQNAPDIVEEAADQLAAPDSQEESDDDFAPEDLAAEDRARYDTAVQAIDAFIDKHPTYKSTDDNRQAILGYLDQHDLAITPASLELCWEQLQDSLDLASEQDSKSAAKGQPDAAVLLAAAQLGTRGNKNEEEPPESADEPVEMPEESGRRGKPVMAWRNGRRVGVAS